MESLPLTLRPAALAAAGSRAPVTPALLLAFLGVQAAVILVGATGPFVDESIYLTAGRRILDGHGLSDGYLTWFAGSLVWPVMAGLAGSLEAARLVAAACVTTGIWGASHAAGALFGERVRPWTALVLVTSGAVLALGHLAVYDAPAVAATGLAFAAVAECHRRDDRLWLALGALALALAGLSKYPALLFAGLPLVAAVLALRGRRWPLDLLVLGFVCTGVLMVYFLLEREQLVAFLEFRVRQNPSFGVTRAMIAYQLAYFAAVPLALALAGAILARPRGVAVALLLGPVVPALYHVGTGTSVGAEKHTVFVLLLAAPLAGVALERAWRAGRARRLVLLALLPVVAGLAVVQCVRLDRSWLDVRPSVAWVVARVAPGDRLLVDNAWPYVERLYAAGSIAAPSDVYDAYRVQHDGRGVSPCEFDWYVESSFGSVPWPDAFRREVRRCGSFVKVYESGSRSVGLRRSLSYFSFDAHVVVFRNERRPS